MGEEGAERLLERVEAREREREGHSDRVGRHGILEGKKKKSTSAGDEGERERRKKKKSARGGERSSRSPHE